MPAGTTCSAQGLPGTIRIYGTPAEEGGAGKVFMIRAGLFRDVDAVLTWHPGNANKADMAALSPCRRPDPIQRPCLTCLDGARARPIRS